MVKKIIQKIILAVSSLMLMSPLLSLAHTGEDDGLHHNMMNGNYPMMNGGWMWIWMILGLVIAILLIVVLAALIIKLFQK